MLVVSRSMSLCRANVLERLPKLKVIFVLGADTAGVDRKFCQRKNIAVVDFPQFNTRALAELAMTSMLMLSHRVHSAWRHVLTNQTRYVDYFQGWNIRDKTLGVVGAGHLGRELVQMGRAFGMEVVCATKRPSTMRARDLGLNRFVPLQELLSLSDFVMLAIPVTSETVGMIGEHQLARMNPDALLVNMVSWRLVDLEAVAKALYERRLGGLAIDTVDFAESTLHGSLLLEEMMCSPNVLLLPRLAEQAYESRMELGDRFLEALTSFL
jgi:phosphoglycerate dehydrogenase-like enzyme